jgi:hypothetical protein
MGAAQGPRPAGRLSRSACRRLLCAGKRARVAGCGLRYFGWRAAGGGRQLGRSFPYLVGCVEQFPAEGCGRDVRAPGFKDVGFFFW